MSVDDFSTSYIQARQRFREAVSQQGGRLETFALAQAPHLTLDIGLLGGDQVKHALVVSSGCHGIEGTFGSAMQTALLRRSTEMTETTRLVLIHAINPHGFHHQRRVNEDNVDLNRNFLLEQEYTGAPSGYRRLNQFLNPTSAPNDWEPFGLFAAGYLLRYGMAALKTAIVSGQYEYPQGIFFGGHCLADSLSILKRNFRNWLGAATSITHIDLHSGLGRFGECKLLLADEPQSPTHRWFCELGFANLTEPRAAPETLAYPVSGLLGDGLRSLLSDRDYRFAVAEFGTYSSLRVLKALRNENRAHFYSLPNSPESNRAKAELLECFCPASDKWRRQVITHGISLLEQLAQQAK